MDGLNQKSCLAWKLGKPTHRDLGVRAFTAEGYKGQISAWDGKEVGFGFLPLHLDGARLEHPGAALHGVKQRSVIDKIAVDLWTGRHDGVVIQGIRGGDVGPHVKVA